MNAALEWLDGLASGAMGMEAFYARRIKEMLAQPRLPAQPSEEAIRDVADDDSPLAPHYMRRYHRALWAHLTMPHVDFAALDEARMDDTSLRRYPRGNAPAPAAGADLRKAISVLRGWSAEAAGRTGLAASVLIVCNAAEATLPVQLYRVRNGAALDVICPGPISISEVPND